MLLSLYNMGLISIYVIVILFGKQYELSGDKVASECKFLPCKFWNLAAKFFWRPKSKIGFLE